MSSDEMGKLALQYQKQAGCSYESARRTVELHPHTLARPLSEAEAREARQYQADTGVGVAEAITWAKLRRLSS